jgi:hypothetical protein
MKFSQILAMVLALGLSAGAFAQSTPSSGNDPAWQRELSAYNVVWTTPSTGSDGSMPIGGGNIGLNVWVQNDDLLIYIGSSDSWNENERQIKVGRLRLSFPANTFTKTFSQELDLVHNCVRVSGQNAEGHTVKLRVWVDAFQPIVHVEGDADQPVAVSAAMELWSNLYQGRLVGDAVEWQHRNNPAINARGNYIRGQHLESIADSIPDVLTNRIFGGRLSAAGFVADGTSDGNYEGMPFHAWKLKTTNPLPHLDIRATLRIAQDAALEKWQAQVAQLEQATRNTARADWIKTAAWWHGFWDRSHIIINPGSQDPNDKAWQVGRNYQLFRAMLASNRTGQFPTLFNGADFLCETNPESREWDGCQFMGQNQRLVYWPMVKSGDDDLLQVGLDYYTSHAKLERAWAKLFWDVEGGVFPEALNVFGTDAIPGGGGRSRAGHLVYHYTTSLDFAMMMLEEQRYTGSDFRNCLPTVLGIISYYDQFYRKENKRKTGQELDANGHLVIEPSCGLEMYTNARNNTDVLAGLMAVTDGLLALPSGTLTAEEKNFLHDFSQHIPPIPTHRRRGHQTLAGGDACPMISNPNEFPQMYAVFPFGIYGLEQPDIELARNTWWYGNESALQYQTQCWFQGGIFNARLGITEGAKFYTLAKFLNRSMRYPAFWDTGYDQRPDIDHGGCAMVGLQEMLLQTPGRKLLLLPAWPKDWNVDFKLHAPYKTTVECCYRNGKIENLVITPASRQADVVDMSAAPPVVKGSTDPLPVSRGKPATASTTYGGGYTPDKAFDGDLSTRWSASNGQDTGWLEVDLGKPMEVSRVVIQEASYPQTTSFTVEAQQADGSWKSLAEGTTIGEYKELNITPRTAQKFRLHILSAKLVNARAGITIDELQLFAK